MTIKRYKYRIYSFQINIRKPIHYLIDHGATKYKQIEKIY